MREGWKIVKLGDIGTFSRGINFLKTDFVENGFPCVHYGQIHTKLGNITKEHLTCIPETLVKKDKLASKGDILIAITSEDVAGSCKCTAWLGDYDIALGAHAACFKHNQNPAFIVYYFQSRQFYVQKEQFTHGFKVVEIKPSDIAKITIPLPPLSEQQSIVAHLDTSFAEIDALKAKAAEEVANAKAMFDAALREEMTPKEGWEEKTLGSLSILITKGASPKWQGIQYVTDNSDGVLFVTSENVRDGHVDIEPSKFVEKKINTIQKRSILKQNDLLINIVGASIGRAAIFSLPIENANINQAVALVRCNNSINLNYILYFLNSSFAMTQYNACKKDTARANLSLKNIAELVIPYPSCEVQQRIVAKLDTLRSHLTELEQKYNLIAANCDALKQAILRETFE